MRKFSKVLSGAMVAGVIMVLGVGVAQANHFVDDLTEVDTGVDPAAEHNGTTTHWFDANWSSASGWVGIPNSSHALVNGELDVHGAYTGSCPGSGDAVSIRPIQNNGTAFASKRFPCSPAQRTSKHWNGLPVSTSTGTNYYLQIQKVNGGTESWTFRGHQHI